MKKWRNLKKSKTKYRFMSFFSLLFLHIKRVFFVPQKIYDRFKNDNELNNRIALLRMSVDSNELTVSTIEKYVIDYFQNDPIFIIPSLHDYKWLMEGVGLQPSNKYNQ
ncbi:MAG: hypothetical protein ACI9TY_001052 [Alphaproteobacteria bacterium]|jgi:hypothetical protein